MSFRTWFRKGLTFKCTQCGACCAAPENAVWINPHEAAQLADALKVDAATFLRNCVEDPEGRDGKWLLKKNRRGECVFLTKERRCSVFKDRPIQCRTYPFWPEHLMSPLDWNAEALMKCEGMRAVPLRDNPEGDVEERTIVQRMLGTELQRQWLEFHPATLESLLEESDSATVEGYTSEFWEANYRQVRLKTERLLVVDTCIGGTELKRSMISKSMPAHVQSEIALRDEEGKLTVRHDRLLQRPYQAMLIALLPYIRQKSEAGYARRRFGMIGAGCGAFSKYLESLSDSLPCLVDAVDLDSEILSIGKEWFGFEATDGVEIFCQDGLEFLKDVPDKTYDLLFVDVAASPPKSPSGIPVSPPAVFYSDSSSELFKAKLKDEGTVLVNITGGLPKLKAVRVTLATTFPHLSAIHIPEATVLFASHSEISLRAAATSFCQKNAFPDDSIDQVLRCINAYHERYRHLGFGWLDHATLSEL